MVVTGLQDIKGLDCGQVRLQRNSEAQVVLLQRFGVWRGEGCRSLYDDVDVYSCSRAVEDSRASAQRGGGGPLVG